MTEPLSAMSRPVICDLYKRLLLDPQVQHADILVYEAERAEFVLPYAGLFQAPVYPEFWVGPGWWPAMEAAFKAMQALETDFPGFRAKLRAVWQQDGCLRLDASCTHPAAAIPGRPWPEGHVDRLNAFCARMDRIERQAVETCTFTCEWCGLPGGSTPNSWTETLCEKHREEKAQMCTDAR